MILRVRKDGDQKILAHHVVPARTPWARMKGLIGRKNLAPGEGIWLVPCNSIHMFGMSIPLDVIFLDRSRKVLKCIRHLLPGKVVWPVRGAHSVLELGVGSVVNPEELVGASLLIEQCPPTTSSSS